MEAEGEEGALGPPVEIVPLLWFSVFLSLGHVFGYFFCFFLCVFCPRSLLGG